MECTVSTEEGRTWSEYQSGTKSRIVLPCPYCRAWVTPEREHFVGWQEAQSLADARATGAFACPACGELWSSAERIAANKQCRVLHDGQTIDEAGRIDGDPPKTNTLGFRWSAVNNLFLMPPISRPTSGARRGVPTKRTPSARCANSCGACPSFQPSSTKR